MNANERTLRERWADAEARGGDVASCKRELARCLIESGRSWDEALTLLPVPASVEDRAERARVLEGLGRFEESAQVLLGSDASPDVTSLLRAASHYARAALPFRARECLEKCASEPGAMELIASIHPWSPEAVSSERAAECFYQVFRAAGGIGSGNALLRAFEADAAYPLSVAELVKAGKSPIAIDSILEVHGRALRAQGDFELTERVTAERMRRAMEANDVPLALVAAFDLELDRSLDAEGVSTFHELLLRGGCFELLASRLAYIGDAARKGEDRVRSLQQLAHLLEGPMANLDRARAAYAAWGEIEPRHPEVEGALARLPETKSDRTESLRRIVELRRAGDPFSAHEESSRLIPASVEVAGVAWVNAALSRDLAVEVKRIEPLLRDVSVSVASAIYAALAARCHDSLLATDGRELAGRAHSLDPQSGPALRALAQWVVDEPSSAMNVAVLESAIRVLGPRRQWLSALAVGYRAQGDAQKALKTAEQAMSLRPGDPVLAGEVVRSASMTSDPERIASAIAWCVSQPIPASTLVEAVRDALPVLRSLDQERASLVAREALDHWGPRFDVFGPFLASNDGRNEFAIRFWERSASADREHRVEHFIRLADAARRDDELESELDGLVRALRAGATQPEVFIRIHELEGSAPTGVAAVLLVEASALIARAESRLEDCAKAYRALARTLWNDRGEKHAALHAWVNAVNASSEGEIAFEAAETALRAEEPDLAFELASLSLKKSPENTNVLELAERGAFQAHREEEMSALYDVIGGLALGRFGRRAAHYRAARVFERRGDLPRALKHSQSAFEAVPSDGASLMTLTRLAERGPDRLFAARAVGNVGDASSDYAVRARWLLRSAEIAPKDEEGARYSVDVLLKAVLHVRDVRTARKLRESAHELITRAPAEKDVLALRVGNATRALTSRAEGPDGARLCIELVLLAVETFDEVDTALTALEKAFVADADLDDYRILQGSAAQLAGGRASRAFFDRAMKRVEEPYSNFGPDALGLLRTMALAMSEAGALEDASMVVDRLSLRIAERNPENAAALLVADAALARLADPELAEKFAKKVPPDEQVEVVRTYIREHLNEGAALRPMLEFLLRLGGLDESSGLALEGLVPDDDALVARSLQARAKDADEREDHEQARVLRLRAAVILEQRLEKPADAQALLESILASWPEHQPTRRYLADLYDRQGMSDKSAALWTELASEATGVSTKIDVGVHASDALIVGGEYEAALEMIDGILQRDPTNESILQKKADLLRRMGRSKELGNVLEELARRGGSSAKATAQLWFEAAEAARDAGSSESARSRATKAIDLAPDLSAAEDLLRTLLLSTDDPFSNLASSIPTALPSATAPRLPSEPPKEILAHREPPADVVATKTTVGLGPEVIEAMKAAAIVATEIQLTSSTVVDLRAEVIEATAAIETSIPTESTKTLAEPLPSLSLSPKPPGVGPDAKRLWEQLQSGAFEAGESIIASGVTTAELVRVRYAQLRARPTDFATLTALAEAAVSDRDLPLVRALQHVQASASLTVAPPPLSLQREQPGIAQLLRPSFVAHEMFAILWTEAPSLFAKDAASYAITGVEHVNPGGSSAVSRNLELALRYMDLPKTPLFVRRTHGSGEFRMSRPDLLATIPTAEIAVRNPASVILAGETREDSAKLRYAMGYALAGARPEHVLLLGLPRANVDVIWDALRGAFGPPEHANTIHSMAAKFAQSFWQSLTPRGQRRITEIYVANPAMSLGTAITQAERSARRSGLFLAGDFGYVLSELCRAKGKVPPGSVQDLLRVIGSDEDARDLYLLATSPAYAHARWNVPMQDPSSVSRIRISG